MLFRRLHPCGILLAFQAGLASAATVASTILILARDDAAVKSATSGFRGYGIPYETLIVPQGGVALPNLTISKTEGKYGGIVVLSEVGYSYGTEWRSALTAAQWQSLYDYQTSFGVRMARIDVYPTYEFGTTTAVPSAGCCAAGVEQLISISNATEFPTANIKTGVGVTTEGLWHYPAKITNASIAFEVAKFAPSGIFNETTTAAVINRIGGRQQLVFFISWATDWSLTSNYLQHTYIHWLTRGLFLGKRKVYLNTQVDDMHLDTDLYEPVGAVYRIGTADLNAHKTWQAKLNSRLPAGSKYFIEMAHNGNGDIIVATDQKEYEDEEYEDHDSYGICDPNYAVDYIEPPDTVLEFVKPLGTGTNMWPAEFDEYPWDDECAALDPIASWFSKAANRDVFAHVSHTFTHLELNNATYSDCAREISFNRAWLDQIGISDSPLFSPLGLVPPAITGLHNGDAIKAWLDNGIKYVVGDNTRPLLRSKESDFWPKISTVEDNGYPGLVIIPRWATTMYYNCDLPDCTLNEWIKTSGGSGKFSNLLDNARVTNVRYLLGLHADPFMFHQANMRQADVEPLTVGTQTGKLSLLQIWVEVITQELTRLTNWPILSLKHDDIATLFLDRMTLDQCVPNLKYVYSADGKTITEVEVTALNNKCAVEVPITLPGTATPVSTSARVSIKSRVDKVGSDPSIIWITLRGSPVSLKLDKPIAV